MHPRHSQVVLAYGNPTQLILKEYAHHVLFAMYWCMERYVWYCRPTLYCTSCTAQGDTFTAGWFPVHCLPEHCSQYSQVSAEGSCDGLQCTGLHRVMHSKSGCTRAVTASVLWGISYTEDAHLGLPREGLLALSGAGGTRTARYAM
jgi:hypothetical protein